MNELLPVFESVVNGLLLAALPVFAVALIAAVVGFTRKQWAQFKATQPTIAEHVAVYAKIAVEAAEQAGIAKLITDKKVYAVGIAARWLVANGLKGIDVELIAAEVERQVREMKLAKLNAG